MKETKDLSFGLWQLLNRTTHLIYKARQKELDRYGISVRSAAVLEVVNRLDKEATPARLSQQIFIERHSISEQLSRMEKEGLLVKNRHPENKNRIRLQATGKGERLFREAMQHESISDIMSELSPEEQHRLWLVLSRLRKRTLEILDMDKEDLYPPSDPDELPAGAGGD